MVREHGDTLSHGVNEHGKGSVRKKLKRAEMLPYVGNLPRA